MGYTHHWEGLVACDNTTWDKIIDEFMRVGIASEVTVAGRDGQGLATLSSEYLCFNGAGEDSYETFHIKRGQHEFGFTKTAHKPYDILVCAMLIILSHYIPTFKVSSDGGPEEWAPAIKLCQDILGYGVYPCKADEVVPEPEPEVVVVFRRTVPEGLKQEDK
jgi:hypothetical protein